MTRQKNSSTTSGATPYSACICDGVARRGALATSRSSRRGSGVRTGVGAEPMPWSCRDVSLDDFGTRTATSQTVRLLTTVSEGSVECAINDLMAHHFKVSVRFFFRVRQDWTKKSLRQNLTVPFSEFASRRHDRIAVMLALYERESALDDPRIPERTSGHQDRVTPRGALGP